MRNKILIIAFAITLLSCKKNEIKNETGISEKKIETIQDTVVNIKPINTVENLDSISAKNATKTLYTYFKSKGFLTQDEIEKKPSIRWLPKNEGKNVIEFSELFLFNNQLGIVTYYNAEIGASGHCIQPHLALISNTVNGLKVSNEGFLSPNFTIDSLKIIDNKPVIYSRDYDCYNHKFLKNYRIKLN